VVGVAGAPIPIKDMRLPVLSVETRGVEALGNGKKLLTLGVRIIVDGVCVDMLGHGGKTNRVWEGV